MPEHPVHADALPAKQNYGVYPESVRLAVGVKNQERLQIKRLLTDLFVVQSSQFHLKALCLEEHFHPFAFLPAKQMALG